MGLGGHAGPRLDLTADRVSDVAHISLDARDRTTVPGDRLIGVAMLCASRDVCSSPARHMSPPDGLALHVEAS
jgi:hypothetical protein